MNEYMHKFVQIFEKFSLVLNLATHILKLKSLFSVWVESKNI